MLQKVCVRHYKSVMSTNVDNDRVLLGDEIVDELRTLSKELRGARICHINATGFRGGVAELLPRHLPILQARVIRSLLV
jgi:hypothetical protein